MLRNEGGIRKKGKRERKKKEGKSMILNDDDQNISVTFLWKRMFVFLHYDEL
jgi:hypothetical protein